LREQGLLRLLYATFPEVTIRLDPQTEPVSLSKVG